MVGEVISNEYSIVFEGKVLDFLGKFEGPPEFRMVREAATSFETNIAEVGAIWVAIDEVSDGCMHWVSFIVHKYCT